jgi:hypothetical protein
MLVGAGKPVRSTQAPAREHPTKVSHLYHSRFAIRANALTGWLRSGAVGRTPTLPSGVVRFDPTDAREPALLPAFPSWQTGRLLLAAAEPEGRLSDSLGRRSSLRRRRNLCLRARSIRSSVGVLNRVLIRRAAVVAGQLACDPFPVMVERTPRRVLELAVLPLGAFRRAFRGDAFFGSSNEGSSTSAALGVPEAPRPGDQKRLRAVLQPDLWPDRLPREK